MSISHPAKRGGGSTVRGRLLRGAIGLAVLTLVTAAPQLAAAQPHIDEDWPCVQRKIETLSPASMWPGVPEEALGADWRADREVAALVSRIAPRRISVEEGQEAIQSFAEGLGEDKEARLTLLFVGLFQALDAERSEVMRGIERFARNQVRLADSILADRAALEDMRQEAPTSEEVGQRSEDLTMAIQIFEGRRAALTHVCEVPRVIEHRLFSFARTIQAELS
jgi:hypothetical protein